MSRSPVPVSIIDPDHQRFLDELWKRRLTAVDEPDALTTDSSSALSLSTVASATAADTDTSAAKLTTVNTAITTINANMTAISTELASLQSSINADLTALRVTLVSLIEEMQARNAMESE